MIQPRAVQTENDVLRDVQSKQQHGDQRRQSQEVFLLHGGALRQSPVVYPYVYPYADLLSEFRWRRPAPPAQCELASKGASLSSREPAVRRAFRNASTLGKLDVSLSSR